MAKLTTYSPVTPPLPEVFTPPEIGGVLRCSKRSVYRLIAAGKLKSVRVGRRVLVTRRALEEFLNTPLARNGDAAPAGGGR